MKATETEDLPEDFELCLQSLRGRHACFEARERFALVNVTFDVVEIDIVAQDGDSTCATSP